MAAKAESTQLLSFTMGRVWRPLGGVGNKFEQLLFHLLLHPEDGLVSVMLREDLTSVEELLRGEGV